MRKRFFSLHSVRTIVSYTWEFFLIPHRTGIGNENVWKRPAQRSAVSDERVSSIQMLLGSARRPSWWFIRKTNPAKKINKHTQFENCENKILWANAQGHEVMWYAKTKDVSFFFSFLSLMANMQFHFYGALGSGDCVSSQNANKDGKGWLDITKYTDGGQRESVRLSFMMFMVAASGSFTRCIKRSEGMCGTLHMKRGGGVLIGLIPEWRHGIETPRVHTKIGLGQMGWWRKEKKEKRKKWTLNRIVGIRLIKFFSR